MPSSKIASNSKPLVPTVATLTETKGKPVIVRDAPQVLPPVQAPKVQPLTTIAAVKAPRKHPVLDPSQSGLGSGAYSDASMAAWFSQPLVKKGEIGRNQWANTALTLVSRAKRASQTYGKKDFNALYRLVLSAGIAYDKAWPTQVQPLVGNLVVQLFGSLGSDTARRILEPPRPLLVTTEEPLDDNN